MKSAFHKVVFTCLVVFSTNMASAQEYSNSINPIGNTQMEGRINPFPKLEVHAKIASISELHEACGVSKWLWALGAFLQGCTTFERDMHWAQVLIAKHSAARDLRHEVKHTCGEYHGDVMPKYIDAWKQRVAWTPTENNVCTPEYEEATYQRLYVELKQAYW
ncbi:hypothetical protein [Chromobacterium sp. IIBBL 290-4]|uniref:hypothetical protein n=1 Tax=Chromobacterium sp. IIBBL 290-4 TaxID=2953890 RepID=UPI0020B890A1|nr:hypothetical protein [Chromobacterium sp. IIBBL 290-4]UTH76656.1 hypothetical protein NKT35_11390 [Chromobacterium sp. IIBBL 290-4]